MAANDFSPEHFTPAVRQAFEFCRAMARTHYENFPVASWFIPAAVRPFIWSIYAFARTADDFADEGTLAPQERLTQLDNWGRQLEECYAGHARHPVFVALAETVHRTGIPQQLLADLLTAFRMDVTKNRYDTFADLLGYCRCSANPVGRLVLFVFDNARERTLALSDHVCTALQLTNFWQDVGVDWRKNRMYLPLEDMSRFGYTELELARGMANPRFKDLLRFQVERTRAMFHEGSPIVYEATPALRFELALTLNGGLRILSKIERFSYDVLNMRPALSIFDTMAVLMTSLLRRKP